jgi:hypothetical protein
MFWFSVCENRNVCWFEKLFTHGHVEEWLQSEDSNAKFDNAIYIIRINPDCMQLNIAEEMIHRWLDIYSYRKKRDDIAHVILQMIIAAGKAYAKEKPKIFLQSIANTNSYLL